MTDQTYNGWTNWETWNVALWVQNDEGFYREARRSYSYPNFVERMGFASSATPDGAKYDSPELDIAELNEMIDELWFVNLAVLSKTLNFLSLTTN